MSSRVGKYICIQELQMDEYNDSLEVTEEVFTVETGTVWEVEEGVEFFHVAGSDGIRLNLVTNQDNGKWIEIYQDTLEDYFIEVN